MYAVVLGQYIIPFEDFSRNVEITFENFLVDVLRAKWIAQKVQERGMIDVQALLMSNICIRNLENGMQPAEC
jgi:hypothetical protein